MSSYLDSRFQSNRASLGRRSTNGSSRPSSIIDDTQPRSRRGSVLFGTFGDEDIQGAVGWPIAARLANEEPIDETIVETEKPKNWRDPHLFYIFPTVFFFSAAFNLSGPCVYWALHDLYNGNEALAGQTNGALTGVYTAFTLIGGPIWAVISNRIGRKIVIVISILSAMLDCGIFIWKDVPVPVLYVSKVLCGSTFSFFTVASAYVSDVSTPSNRAFGFSMIW
ncbi:major facilitator superfamily protein, partial [Planoprotostelium fungivorum]